MRLLRYGENPREIAKYISLARNLIDKTKSSNDGADYPMLIIQLAHVLFTTSGNLEGKTILDLGCGSKDKDGIFTVYEPWLCRTLHRLGAYSIGIDLRNNGEEDFEFCKVDLLQEDSLSFLLKDSVDVANAFSLFDSPALFRIMEERGIKEDPKNILIPQLERIVKPNGYFLYSELTVLSQ